MSSPAAAEIADNKWELQAVKPPITEPASFMQMIFVGAIALFFAWIAVMSVVALFTDNTDNNLADKIGEMQQRGKPQT